MAAPVALHSSRRLSTATAVLIQTGYKLTKPDLFVKRWKQGYTQFVPFVATVVAILFTDLLKGIVIGLVIGFIFVIARNFRPAVTFVQDGEGPGASCMVRAKRNLYFIHKVELTRELDKVPDDCTVVIDLSATSYVDLDNIDILNGFIKNAQYRGINVLVRGDIGDKTAPQIKAPRKEVAYA